MRKKENKMMLRRLLSAYLSSVISISLALLLIGIATALLTGARALSEQIRSGMQVEVFLEDGATEAEAEALLPRIGAVRGVATVSLVSEEEGRAELEQMLGEDFLGVFEDDEIRIPLSFSVTLEPDCVAADSLSRIGGQIAALPQVEGVSYPESLIEQVGSNLRKVSIVLALLIAAALFISFVLIGNTVRINVFARRFTIHTMKLVGATKRFIRRPFMLRSLVQGLAAALLAMIWTALLLWLLYREAPGVAQYLLGRDTLLLLAGVEAGAGVLICLLATRLSMGRLLSMNKDQLYF